MKTVILGATRGMGRALARRMAERGDELFLLGRDPAELEACARDLDARSGGGGRNPVAGSAPCDLSHPASFGPALDAARERLGRVECVVVTAALFASQDELEADLDRLEKLLTADFTNTVLFCERARRMLLEGSADRPPGARAGTLCVFSSVAGDRGRKPVLLYGAAKAGLSYYLEGLDHKFRERGLVTICVKPGFVKTGMTAGLKPPPFAGEPDQVARAVLRAIDRGAPMVYVPWPWAWVMRVIRNLPRFVMRKIGF